MSRSRFTEQYAFVNELNSMMKRYAGIGDNESFDYQTVVERIRVSDVGSVFDFEHYDRDISRERRPTLRSKPFRWKYAYNNTFLDAYLEVGDFIRIEGNIDNHFVPHINLYSETFRSRNIFYRTIPQLVEGLIDIIELLSRKSQEYIREEKGEVHVTELLPSWEFEKYESYHDILSYTEDLATLERSRKVIPIQELATILRDKGLPVRLTKTHGYVDDILFTGEYARFGKNPNLYYFKPNAASAADFIEDCSATLRWTDKDWAQSLECEKDELYFVCQMYHTLVKKPRLLPEEKRQIYYMFKDAMGHLLDDYSVKYGLPHGGMDLKCTWANLGYHYGWSNKISFNSDLIMFPPNFIKSVILHELCHSAFYNHRRKFWLLLQELMVDAGLTPVTGYVVPELFGQRKDYYITIPISDLRFRSCLQHPNLFKDIKSKDK